MMQATMPATSSRILYDIPCSVCMDNSSGKHYGVFVCDGCAGFFKRSVRRERNYICKARVPGSCIIDKIRRNQCRACRLAKCIVAGMNKDAVQHERGPRNSTIRRQIELFKNSVVPSSGQSYPMNTMPMPAPMPLPPPMPLAPPLTSNAIINLNRYNIFHTPPFIPQPSLAAPVLPVMNIFRHGNDPLRTSEAAARVLFLNVKWAKSIISFESLSLPDRVLLIEESWTELFVLGVAQFIYPLDLNALMDLGWQGLDRESVDSLGYLLAEIAQIQIDDAEYFYLRMLILFKTNFRSVDFMRRSSRSPQDRRLQDLRSVAEVQNLAQTALNMCVVRTYPDDINRAEKMYNILVKLRDISENTIIELFFRNTIGDITVMRIITDLYKSGRIPEIPFDF